jgi:hypothetical protein
MFKVRLVAEVKLAQHFEARLQLPKEGTFEKSKQEQTRKMRLTPVRKKPAPDGVAIYNSN